MKTNYLVVKFDTPRILSGAVIEESHKEAMLKEFPDLVFEPIEEDKVFKPWVVTVGSFFECDDSIAGYNSYGDPVYR